MKAVHSFKVFGERCSGTNFAEKLVAENVRGLPLRTDLDGKHFFPTLWTKEANDCLFIFVHRNPFDWLRSLHRKPWHVAPELKNRSFSDFIRTEWRCVWNEEAGRKPGDPDYGTEMTFERCPATDHRFSNAIRMRTAKLRAWEALRLMMPYAVNVCYETLSVDPESFIRSLADRFKLPRVSPFKNVEGYKGHGGLYAAKVYDPIPEADFRFILDELDAGLENDVGYNVHELASARDLK